MNEGAELPGIRRRFFEVRPVAVIAPAVVVELGRIAVDVAPIDSGAVEFPALMERPAACFLGGSFKRGKSGVSAS
jgi:hypothetical protein